MDILTDAELDALEVTAAGHAPSGCGVCARTLRLIAALRDARRVARLVAMHPEGCHACRTDAVIGEALAVVRAWEGTE